jgi:FMN phosphatase YigB (HAD superfamily)
MSPERASPGGRDLVFDCGDTLLALSPSREEICLESLRALGCDFTRAEVALAYRCVDFTHRQRASELVEPEAKARFLREFNGLLCSALGIGTLSERFDALQRETFRRLRRWARAPGVEPALAELARAHRLHVLANWDRKLPALLAEVDLARFFRGIHASEDLGAEKPDARAFQRFAERSGVRLERAVYVGNEYRTDVEGSRAVGMQAVLMDWRGAYGRGVDCPRVGSWAELPAVIAALRGAPER